MMSICLAKLLLSSIKDLGEDLWGGHERYSFRFKGKAFLINAM